MGSVITVNWIYNTERTNKWIGDVRYLQTQMLASHEMEYFLWVLKTDLTYRRASFTQAWPHTHFHQTRSYWICQTFKGNQIQEAGAGNLVVSFTA